MKNIMILQMGHNKVEQEVTNFMPEFVAKEIYHKGAFTEITEKVIYEKTEESFEKDDAQYIVYKAKILPGFNI